MKGLPAALTVAVNVTGCPGVDGFCEENSWMAGVTREITSVTGAEVLAVKVATPLLLSVPVPSVVVPSRKVTVPVGVPLPDVAATVAVNVTGWPNTDGLADEVKVTVAPVRLSRTEMVPETVALP